MVGRSIGVSLARVVWIAGFLWMLTGPDAGRVSGQILQEGDMVIGGARVVDSFGNAVGRLYRYRDGVVDTIFDGGTTLGLGPIGRLFIDSQARIVFSTYGCGGNSNSSALWRVDLATSIAEQLACFPYVANSGNIPPGLPPDASSFYQLASLYPTKSLRVSIDDDVNGGMPQVSHAEAYGCSIGVTIDGVTRPRAFRYLPGEDRFENDVPLDQLSPNGGPPQIIVEGVHIYYAHSFGQIGKAQPSLVADFSFDGNWGSFSGQLEVRGRNELIMNGDILDNTLIPNSTAKCGDLEDDNVPEQVFHPLGGITNLGFVDGGMFATSNSGAAGRPYLFNLARRDPFLNPYCCCFYNAVEHSGPIEFFQGADPDVVIGDGGRVLATQRFAGKLLSVQPSGAFQVLASDLVGPVGVAVYPPRGDAQTARHLTLRLDEPIGHVLLTDPDGQRLGYDATGSEVNDFGDRAIIVDTSQQGSPVRFYTLSDPANGNWQVHLAGTGFGPYTLRAYLADTSEGGTTVMADGDVEIGVTDRYRMVVTPPLGLLLTAAHRTDFDGDGDVDGNDVGLFVGCASGPTVPLPPGCVDKDLDGDGDGDQADFGVMQLCYSGEGNPVDPNCICLTYCDGACVDLMWDSGNCGACGVVCPDQFACAWGVCEGICYDCQ